MDKRDALKEKPAKKKNCKKNSSQIFIGGFNALELISGLIKRNQLKSKRMGCNSSKQKAKKSKQPSSGTLASIPTTPWVYKGPAAGQTGPPSHSQNPNLINRPKFCLDQAPVHQKNQLHSAIKTNHIENVARLITLFNVEPNEECSIKGHFWTALHYAVYFDRPEIIEYFAKTIYKRHKEDYIEIMNLKTKDDMNPMMLAALYGRKSALEMLFKCGGIRLYERNKKGQIALEIAIFSQKFSVEAVLKKEMDRLTKPTNTPLNKEFLEDFNELQPIEKSKDFEDQDAYAQLLLKGKPLPCLACGSNKGWLKYSNCCGQAYHAYCVEKTLHCLVCNYYKFHLTNQIKHPERAFTLA